MTTWKIFKSYFINFIEKSKDFESWWESLYDDGVMSVLELSPDSFTVWYKDFTLNIHLNQNTVEAKSYGTWKFDDGDNIDILLSNLLEYINGVSLSMYQFQYHELHDTF